MKKFILVLVFFAFTAATNYETVLKSHRKLNLLFSVFTGNFNKHFHLAEAPLRRRIFKRDLRRIVQLNKLHAGQWKSGVNKFTAMTKVEKSQYLGLNISRALSANSAPIPRLSSVYAAPTKDWREESKVTGAKDQGRCGSCWSFAATAAVETNYAINTGRRKQFSEQEYLDCSYEGTERNGHGCHGGWYCDAWEYSINTGRLATLAAAPYKLRDGKCSYSKVHNGLIAAKIYEVKTIPAGEANVIRFLNLFAISVAFEVTDDFFKYTGGILRDDTCRSLPNHAVTAVGYTKDAMIVKNSWGSWGLSGFFYTARNHHGCQIYNYGSVPLMTATGKADTDAEYVHKDGDECRGINADGCSCGTVRCKNGKCKHAHMCH